MADHAESSREAFCSDFIVRLRNALQCYLTVKITRLKTLASNWLKVGFCETINKVASAVLGKVCGRNLRR